MNNSKKKQEEEKMGISLGHVSIITYFSFLLTKIKPNASAYIHQTIYLIGFRKIKTNKKQ